MNTSITSLCIHLRSFVVGEEGQELIEFALVVALLAGIGFFATGLNEAFSDATVTVTTNVN
jgi:hypothetical protein